MGWVYRTHSTEHHDKNASQSDFVQSGIPTRTTPTLTPTTMKNIEQLFDSDMAYQSHSNQAGFVPPPIEPTGTTIVDGKNWIGGSVTLVQNIKEPCLEDDALMIPSSLLHSGIPTSVSELPLPKRTGGRHAQKDSKLNTEEDKRKQQRRERNKQAAARCRKRRLDQTNQLQDETDELNEKKACLKHEIDVLRQQKEELEFLLSSHQGSCKKDIVENKPVSRRPMRPTSLAVNPTSRTLPELGIAIETPSNCIRGLGFDTLLESPGLSKTEIKSSPCNSSHENSTSTSVSNCSAQQRQEATDLSSPDSNSSSLVSL